MKNLKTAVYIFVLLFSFQQFALGQITRKYVSKVEELTDKDGSKSLKYNETYFDFNFPTLKYPNKGSFRMAFKGLPTNMDPIDIEFKQTESKPDYTSHTFLPPRDDLMPLFDVLVWFISHTPSDISGYKYSAAIIWKDRGTTTIYYVLEVQQAPDWALDAWDLGIKKSAEDAEKISGQAKKLQESLSSEKGTKELGDLVEHLDKNKSNQSPESGYASYTYENGTFCTGNWRNGNLNGKGKCIFNNGDVYDGDFVASLKQGYGKFTWKNGDIYQGKWKADIMDGQGKMNYANGNLYEGTWLNGKKHGQGKMIFSTGTTYVGQWQDDMMTGKAKISYSNGEAYEGEMENALRNGTGKNTYTNGDIYSGQWKDNMRHGWGTYAYANGDKLVGNLKEDKMDGKVTKSYADGRIVEIEYAKGEMLSEKVIKKEDDYEGIGIRFKFDSEKVHYVITYVGVKSPAQIAGLLVDDIMFSANGVNFKGKNIDELAPLIKGPSGTTVNMGITRNGESMIVPVKRGKIVGEDLYK